jgi:hypothetical protein
LAIRGALFILCICALLFPTLSLFAHSFEQNLPLPSLNLAGTHENSVWQHWHTTSIPVAIEALAHALQQYMTDFLGERKSFPQCLHGRVVFSFQCAVVQAREQ